jgi:hypothetical protein
MVFDLLINLLMSRHLIMTWLGLSTLPRGAVAGVAAAPAPLGVSATVLCVRSLHRLLLVTTIVALCADFEASQPNT